MMPQRSILLIISGSIAAYKSLDLIRRLRERNYLVRCILTKGGEQFITPLSVASLSGNQTYTDLFSLKDETEMGHIRLSREADLVIVAPASADIIAKTANGQTDDLATATLLASDKPLMIVPAMNTKMWQHPATQRNLAQIKKDGAVVIAPAAGDLACGEVGEGRMADVDAIVKAIVSQFGDDRLPLSGVRALVTSGPTFEAIDPVRFIGNRSSGKQGHAIAEALAKAGAQVTLISGPVALADPKGVKVVHVETAQEMLVACEKSLPADVAVFAAAVSDWRAKEPAKNKIKKSKDAVPHFSLKENPDILRAIASHKKRPSLVIGFAAETEDLIKNASAKRREKNCDWILANDVSKGFGADDNQVTLIDAKGEEKWPRLSKHAVAERLAERIAFSLRATKRKSA